jgi:hypothetical protein
MCSPPFFFYWGNMIIQRIYKKLASLLDVRVTSPADGQVLKYSAGTWVNGDLSQYFLTSSAAALEDQVSTLGDEVASALQSGNNLSDLASAPTARGNLGLGSAATQASSAFDTSGAAAAVQANVTTLTTTVSGKLTASNNLSDVANASTALTNLGGVSTSRTINGFTLSGNVTISTITGNAGTATALQTARTINGTSFDGTANVTITAAAGSLTGTTLNATVVASSLTSVGTLTNLNILASGTGPSAINSWAGQNVLFICNTSTASGYSAINFGNTAKKERCAFGFSDATAGFFWTSFWETSGNDSSGFPTFFSTQNQTLAAPPKEINDTGSFDGVFEFRNQMHFWPNGHIYFGNTGGGLIALATQDSWIEGCRFIDINRRNSDVQFGRYDSASRVRIEPRNQRILIGGQQVLQSQQAAIAHATDAASVITQCNLVIDAMRAHGLIAADVSAAAGTVQTGFVSYWKFDEDTCDPTTDGFSNYVIRYDSVGSNHVGVGLANQPFGGVGSKAGFIDRACQFNGVYMQIASNSTLQAGATSFGGCFWAKTLGAQSGFARIFCKDGEYVAAFTGHNPYIDIRSGAAAVNPSVEVADGNWHFWLWQYDNSAHTLSLYIDNVLVGTPASYTHDGTVNTNALSFGAKADGSQPVNALVDEVGWWKGVVKSSTERTFLYNSGVGRTWPMR